MDFIIHFSIGDFFRKLPIIQTGPKKSSPASNFAKDGNSDSTVSEIDFLGSLKFIAGFRKLFACIPTGLCSFVRGVLLANPGKKHITIFFRWNSQDDWEFFFFQVSKHQQKGKTKGSPGSF